MTGEGTLSPISSHLLQPCLCLCLGMEQITRTTPLRCTILHLTQIFFTDARTFMTSSTAQFFRLFSLVSVNDAPA